VRIWIDLSNSPHPLLFAPIARRLKELGHEVGVTARDNAQTVELTLERWPDATIIGGQSPKSRAQKAQVMAQRVRDLGRWARRFRADIALSHNSYGQIVAARALGLRVVTAMDYEGQPANHLAFRLAHVILMPKALRDSGVHRQGANDRRTRFYPGFKEEIYLGDFEPDPAVLDSLGIARDGRPLVVARTPPSRAAYHQFDNPLFGQIIEALGHDPNAVVVVLVRHPEQRQAIKALDLTNVVVPDHAIDSRSTMYQADLVIGAGGTMTREASLMGIPTYSVFAGEQPAVDRELEKEGHLRRLQYVDELVPVRPRPADPRPVTELRDRAAIILLAFVSAVADATADASDSQLCPKTNPSDQAVRK
jgi:predicted glycosyltransferase